VAASWRALILSGGIFHPFAETSEVLAEIFGELGGAAEITEDVEGGALRLAREPFDMVAVNALRWGMMTADKYEPYRADWAFQVSPEMRAALTGFVAEGGALFGLHTASICFDDWPEWGDLLGGAWEWGRSHHPPPAPVEIAIAPIGHPITQGLSGFQVTDEIYHHLSPRADADILLTAQNTDEGRQPIAWARAHGAGRVVYDGLGHDGASLNTPGHREIVARAALWALGRLGEEQGDGR